MEPTTRLSGDYVGATIGMHSFITYGGLVGNKGIFYVVFIFPDSLPDRQ